jgi:hypothetical protein
LAWPAWPPCPPFDELELHATTMPISASEVRPVTVKEFIVEPSLAEME